MSQDWKFDESIVSVFDTHAEQSIPFYNDMHNMVTKISDWFLQDNTNMYDLGTSTGKVIRNLREVYEDRGVHYIGIDNSEDMVEYTRKLFSNKLDVTINKDDISHQHVSFKNASVICSILTLQFIPKRFRQEIVNKVYNGLVEGGCFIFVEKVLSESPELNEVWSGLYNDLKISNHLSPQHVLEKSSSLRGVMTPVTLKENITMLEKSGFKNIDCFFRWGNFAGLLAIK